MGVAAIPKSTILLAANLMTPAHRSEMRPVLNRTPVSMQQGRRAIKTPSSASPSHGGKRAGTAPFLWTLQTDRGLHGRNHCLLCFVTACQNGTLFYQSGIEHFVCWVQPCSLVRIH